MNDEKNLHPTGTLTVAQIQIAVAAYYNTNLIEMVSDRRSQKVARPRQIAMYMARKMTTKSLPVIGNCFGGRDHSTIVHGVNKIEALIKTDTEIANDVLSIKKLIPTLPPAEEVILSENLELCPTLAKNALIKKSRKSKAFSFSGPAEEVRRRLSTLFGQKVQSHGVISAGRKMELLVSRSGTWTILEINQKKHTATMLANGDCWKRSSEAIYMEEEQ